jgi:UPF0716 family protein affecting phage T7 exclusion
MKHNISTLDRLIRIILAVLFAIPFATGILTNALGIILLIASVIALTTGLFRFCFVYAIFGIKTCKDDDENCNK